MKEMLKNNMDDIVRKAKRKRALKKVLALLCAVNILATMMSLKLDASTLENIYNDDVGIQSVETVSLAEENNEATEMDYASDDGSVGLEEPINTESVDLEPPSEEIDMIDLGEIAAEPYTEDKTEQVGEESEAGDIKYSDPM